MRADLHGGEPVSKLAWLNRHGCCRAAALPWPDIKQSDGYANALFTGLQWCKCCGRHAIRIWMQTWILLTARGHFP